MSCQGASDLRDLELRDGLPLGLETGSSCTWDLVKRRNFESLGFHVHKMTKIYKNDKRIQKDKNKLQKLQETKQPNTLFWVRNDRHGFVVKRTIAHRGYETNPIIPIQFGKIQKTRPARPRPGCDCTTLVSVNGFRKNSFSFWTRRLLFGR